jgi:ribosomal protein S18 acetylase RimI-like enzyme
VIDFAPLEPGEEAAVAALWQACGLTRPWNDPARDIAYAMQEPCATILLGKVEGHLVSTVMAGHDGHRGALYYVAVDPACQGRGYGTATVRAAEAWLRRQGVWKVNLLVRRENEQVSAFYSRLGYHDNNAISFGKQLEEPSTDAQTPSRETKSP